MTDAAVTEDGLLDNTVVVRQPRDGFRAAIDSVFLAAAVPARDGDAVFEPGAGVGAAALCLARRVAGIKVSGVEIQPDMVRLAGDNIRLNGLEDRVEVMVGGLERLPPKLIPASFGHVMLNPPYMPDDRADPPPDGGKAVAVVEAGTDLKAWIDRSLKMLRSKGYLTLIHRADRLDDILWCLRGRAGEIVVFPLWPGRPDKAARRVIVRARKDIATPLRLAPGLVLHHDDGRFTDEADAVLRGATLIL